MGTAGSGPLAARVVERIHRLGPLSFCEFMELALYAPELGFYETVYGDYAQMFREVDRWEAVTAADVQRAAQTYLDEQSQTTVELIPGGKAPALPTVRALPVLD